MATTKQTPKHPSKPSEPNDSALFPPSHSGGYQQARRNWRENWQAVFEQCSDYFVRY
jgi:hypothetical protein